MRPDAVVDDPKRPDRPLRADAVDPRPANGSAEQEERSDGPEAPTDRSAPTPWILRPRRTDPGLAEQEERSDHGFDEVVDVPKPTAPR